MFIGLYSVEVDYELFWRQFWSFSKLQAKLTSLWGSLSNPLLYPKTGFLYSLRQFSNSPLRLSQFSVHCLDLNICTRRDVSSAFLIFIFEKKVLKKELKFPRQNDSLRSPYDNLSVSWVDQICINRVIEGPVKDCFDSEMRFCHCGSIDQPLNCPLLCFIELGTHVLCNWTDLRPLVLASFLAREFVCSNARVRKKLLNIFNLL